MIVSEAGASVYSASETAAAEFPDLDVSLRGAVSIARRLQDPLAELVKIEPKSIGVGQYQHDVDQYRLGRSLDAVVEDAVNAVGVDLNTASAPLLARVSGLGASLAEAIVAHRDANGPFASRKELLKVPRLGPRTFEQCAGFLRIPSGERAARCLLGASGSLWRRQEDRRRLRPRPARADGRQRGAEGARSARIRRRALRPADGAATSSRNWKSPAAIRARSFKTATFADGVDEIKDLKPGMMLEGTVTNVAAFGAFVDIGVHQDGLVHVSQLADRFVKDPHEVVKAGDVVKVRVVEVDIKRKRIALSMRKHDDGSAASRQDTRSTPVRNASSRPPERKAPDGKPESSMGALGAKLAEAMQRK